MTVKTLSKNQTVIENGSLIQFFSYGLHCITIDNDNKNIIVTSDYQKSSYYKSVTTSKHIAVFLKNYGFDLKFSDLEKGTDSGKLSGYSVVFEK